MVWTVELLRAPPLRGRASCSTNPFVSKDASACVAAVGESPDVAATNRPDLSPYGRRANAASTNASGLERVVASA